MGRIMKSRQIKSAGLSVSTIGLGTVKFGRNAKVHYPAQFELPSDKAIAELLNCAEDLGINLLDTAPAYGLSEERLGKLLKGQRNKWVISSKVGEEFDGVTSYFDFTPAHIKYSIERSLKRLNTDYLDIVLVHSNGEDQKIIEEYSVFDTLHKMKQAGHIRAFGMSTKTVNGGMLAVEQSDVVMVMHNPIYTEEQAVIDYAHQLGKGIFIKKALASGHLEKIPGADAVKVAMDCIFQEQGVTSVIVGTLNPDHLKHNVSCAIQAQDAHL